MDELTVVRPGNYSRLSENLHQAYGPDRRAALSLKPKCPLRAFNDAGIARVVVGFLLTACRIRRRAARGSSSATVDFSFEYDGWGCAERMAE